MEILLQLGANETAFIQFALFIVSITTLIIFVYGPFFKAYDERHKLTKGADEVANETQDEVKKLELVFQSRAREINEKIKNIFDKSRKQAAEASVIILNLAKSQATIETEKSREEILKQKNAAIESAKIISNDVANEISKKLTGAQI